MAPVTHPTPDQVFEIASKYSTLLRTLFYHPQFKYAQPPTAQFVRPDPDQTPDGLLLVSDFIQTTYVDHVIPFLPHGATRKCKAIGNPWAYNDPDYQWEWEWDAEAGQFKDPSGNIVSLPRVPEAEINGKATDMAMRTMLAKKSILDNATDAKARIIIGGTAFDFGNEVKRAVEELHNSWQKCRPGSSVRIGAYSK